MTNGHKMNNLYSKLISLIFSRCSPTQLIVVSVLACVLGFLPGFGYSPLLYVTVVVLVLILRVSLGLFVIIWLPSMLLAYLIQPIVFAVGVLLVDGVANSYINIVVNTPILAYAGLEYYLVTGGVACSVIIGIILGVLLKIHFKMFIFKKYRTMNINICDNKYNSFITLVKKTIYGIHGNNIDWSRVYKYKLRHPFRISGILFVTIICAIITYSTDIIQTSMVSNIIKQQLAEANGATVDFKSFKLDIIEGTLKIDGLSAANYNNLGVDSFYAKRLDADIDLSMLSRKAVALTSVEVIGLDFDHVRDKKGILFSSSVDIDDSTLTTNIDESVGNAQLAGESYQVVDIDSTNKKSDDTIDISTSIKQALTILASFNSSPTIDQGHKPSIYKNVYQQAKVIGYVNVKNTKMTNDYPDLTIKTIVIKKYKSDNDIYRINVENLSSNPSVLAQPTTFRVRTINNDSVDVFIFISNMYGVSNRVTFRISGLPDDILSDVRIMGYGITADSMTIYGKGKWTFSGTDNIVFKVPFELDLNGVSIKLGAINLDMLDISMPAIVSGNLDNSSVGLNTNMITKSLSFQVLINKLKELGIEVSDGVITLGKICEKR